MIWFHGTCAGHFAAQPLITSLAAALRGGFAADRDRALASVSKHEARATDSRCRERTPHV